MVVLLLVIYLVIKVIWFLIVGLGILEIVEWVMWVMLLVEMEIYVLDKMGILVFSVSISNLIRSFDGLYYFYGGFEVIEYLLLMLVIKNKSKKDLKIG